MRLLNVHTLRLEEYFGDSIPNYAILSHCWGEGEVTFQDINGRSWQEMPGFTKIYYACYQSRKDCYDFVWIDTCCIDKSSSAELSEAINSMYSWYQRAKVCYAYLEDVTTNCSDINLEYSEFRRSRWFTRGWTLQELLAPEIVVFFGKSWNQLGHKGNLANLISSITRIHPEAVESNYAVSEASIARKMSWAAERQTTRIEDMAYSLLGIFDVNMPLLYGEGGKAFTRLQEHILKESDDQSIFAWDLPNDDSRIYGQALLASSPDCFINSGDIVPTPSKEGSQSYSMTNKGLRITIPLYTVVTDSPFEKSFYLALLDCQYENDFSGCLCIPLFKTKSNDYQRILARGDSFKIRKCTDAEATGAEERSIYIIVNPERSYTPFQNTGLPNPVLIKTDEVKAHGYQITDVLSQLSTWFGKTQVLRMFGGITRPWAILQFNNDGLNYGFFVVIIEIRAYNPQTGIKVSLIPLHWTLDELFKLLEESEPNGNYKHEALLAPVFGKANGHPLETSAVVVAHVREETVLNQNVTILDFKIYNEPRPFQQQRTSTPANLLDYGFSPRKRRD